MRFTVNPAAERGTYTADEARVICVHAARVALTEMAGWRGYAVSPLWNLEQLAQHVGIGSVLCKDETHRFGLGSFKALGGAYAAGAALGRRGAAETLPTLCCATDGNHGQSVAFAARRHGCGCVVFVHEHACDSKVSAIRALGAEVVRVPGNYDDSVEYARRTAAEQGWLLISDTSDSPNDQVAAQVMHGYGVMSLELFDQLDNRLPTHVFIQAGVGGLAAAIAGCFAEIGGAGRPLTVVVEPEAAACVMESARYGKPTRIGGDLATNMAMLSCGMTSAPAWIVLQRRADAFMAVSDDAADEAASLLRRYAGTAQDLKVTATAAAGLAGLVAALADRKVAARLELGSTSRVLIFATEGADPGAAAGDQRYESLAE